MPSSVLFLCTGNSCRSQMAEGWLRELAPESVGAYSAGTHPQGLNPGAVRAMARHGIDIASQRSRSIDEFASSPPELLITVCDAAAEACPTLPGSVAIEHWPFEDPASAVGTEAEVSAVFDRICLEIRDRIQLWLASFDRTSEA